MGRQRPRLHANAAGFRLCGVPRETLHQCIGAAGVPLPRRKNVSGYYPMYATQSSALLYCGGMCPIDKSSGASRRHTGARGAPWVGPSSATGARGMLTWRERVSEGLAACNAVIMARVLTPWASLRLHGGVPPYPGDSGRRITYQFGQRFSASARCSTEPKRRVGK